MRRIIVFGAILFVTISVMAQKRVQSLSVELLGAQNMAGINYDSRLKGNSGFGYRVGIGFGYGDNSGLFDQDIKGAGVPIELNYLLGKKNHKLELGLGVSLGIYHVKESTWYYYHLFHPKPKGMTSNTHQQAISSAISYLAILAIVISATMVLCSV